MLWVAVQVSHIVAACEIVVGWPHVELVARMIVEVRLGVPRRETTLLCMTTTLSIPLQPLAPRRSPQAERNGKLCASVWIPGRGLSREKMHVRTCLAATRL